MDSSSSLMDHRYRPQRADRVEAVQADPVGKADKLRRLHRRAVDNLVLRLREEEAPGARSLRSMPTAHR
jgi:hypothetical protein